MRIELIYDNDCPNVNEARHNLKSALEKVGMPPSWTEIDRNSDRAPPHTRSYGSPTILIDGRDVGGPGSQSDANCCRIYSGHNGMLLKAPPSEKIIAAIRGGAGRRGATGRLSVLGAGLGAIASFLPVISCPACWPAYAGILSSFGIGFFDYGPYLNPLMILLLSFSLWTLFDQARFRKRWKLFVLGFVGALGVFISRFWMIAPFALYTSITFLVVASVLNARQMGQHRRFIQG